ncbi:MAG: hypothetical protein HWN68_10970 [Desulfobacterales bacterium]|nr:hypothetical protein [Desulfobacterales bacterium]
MALKVKPIDKSTEKWEERARGASAEFAENAKASASLWEQKTKAAADNYGMAISAPGIKTRFERGVSKAGAAKFLRKIESVAEGRYPGGITAATSDYKAGAEPYYSVLAALTLDPRKPRGDPGNIKRVEQVTKALNAKRLALLGAGGGGG